MKAQTTRRKFTPEFKAKVVIEAVFCQVGIRSIIRRYQFSGEFLANSENLMLADVLLHVSRGESVDEPNLPVTKSPYATLFSFLIMENMKRAARRQMHINVPQTM